MRPTKTQLRQARKRRIRAKVTGTSARPRLTVFCSLTSISAQIIDDTAGKTLVAVTSKEAGAKGKNIEAAKKVGVTVAKKAKDAKITSIVFDRNSRKYHGRIKALADAAREGGLQF
jgi:large subunit ribosomal protein L18